MAEDLHWLHELIAEQKGIEMANQEIMPDHVQLFVNAHPIFAPAKHPELRNQLWNGHLWNPSYYAGTCGDAAKDVIERYVAMQKVK